MTMINTDCPVGSDHSLAAKNLDQKDSLKSLREEFVFPVASDQRQALYFAGHSLGLMPKKTEIYVHEVLDDWGRFAVEGHSLGQSPWYPYHEYITKSFANLTGAKENEVVAMNSLTVNLHLMLVSFYRPTSKRYKILIENNAFPSDKYAVDSQARFHGFEPNDAIVELVPEVGQITVSDDAIEEQIKEQGDSLALVMLGNCNYLSGQKFDFQRVINAARSVGANVGFNLAHGIGNLVLHLHEWEPDFAVWCSYKYLNAGPGGIAGAFVHERHLKDNHLQRFAGWWGHNKTTRFQMGTEFDPIDTVESWQLSNPPILQLACLRASMDIFDRTNMVELRKKGDELTAFLERMLLVELNNEVEIITPAKSRGSMLCLRFKKNPKLWKQRLKDLNIYVDFREPDIIRVTPNPLYNSFSDVYLLVKSLKAILEQI